MADFENIEKTSVSGTTSADEGFTNMSDDSNTEKKETAMDKVIKQIARQVAAPARHSDIATVEALTVKVLATIMAINCTDEFAVGIKVDGELYRFNEYLAPANLRQLVVPRRIVVMDSPSAVDFLDRKAYRVSTAPLTPADFSKAIRVIKAKIRATGTDSELSKLPVELLAAASNSTLLKGRVKSRTQNRLICLTVVIDQDHDVDVKTWASMFGATLFD